MILPLIKLQRSEPREPLFIRCHLQAARKVSAIYNGAMSVGFLSDDELRERRRAELRAMSDEQLIRHGKTIR
jgi:hypothetical protein